MTPVDSPVDMTISASADLNFKVGSCVNSWQPILQPLPPPPPPPPPPSPPTPPPGFHIHCSISAGGTVSTDD